MIKTPYYLLLLVIAFSNLKCNTENTSRNISFWTNKNLADESYNKLLINENSIDLINPMNGQPSCEVLTQSSYEIFTNSIVSIHLQNEFNDKIYLGSLGLDNFSDGVHIIDTNSNINASIIIKGTSNNDCTTVEIFWN